MQNVFFIKLDFFFVNLKVDVIVNSVGQDLVMIFGFCFVIVVVVGFNFVKELFQNNISFFYGKVVVIKGYNLNCVEVFYGVLLLWYFKGVGNMNQLDIVSFYKQYVQCKKKLIYCIYIIVFFKLKGFMIIQVFEEFVYKCLEKVMLKGYKIIVFLVLGVGNFKFLLNVVVVCMVVGIVKFFKKYSIVEV